MSKNSSLISITFRKFLNFFGFAGVTSILYGATSTYTITYIEHLDRWVNLFSSFLTILGALITSLSVYIWKKQPDRPEKFSLYISAPIVALSSILAIILLFIYGKLPISIVNGFAMLAISGALFRIQPHTTE